MDSGDAIVQGAAMLPVVLAWETFKDWLSASVGLSHWDLHVILGLAVYAIAARALRRPAGSFWPILPVAVLELGNETLDFLRAWIPHWAWNWRDTLVEVALTLGPPLAVVLAIRARPTVVRGWRALVFRVRFPRRREHIHVSLHRDRRER